MNREQFRKRVVREVESVYPQAFKNFPLDRGGESRSLKASQGKVAQFADDYTAALAEPSQTIEHVDDLLGLRDTQLVRHCYLGILGREPDEIGFLANLRGLREGTDPVTIIRSFVESPEGVQRKAKLRGLNRLKTLHKLEKLPWVGRWFSFWNGLRRASKLTRRVERLEELILRQQRLIAELTEPPPAEQEFDQEDYDRFYLEFENQFRGRREMIKARQRYYLPIIQDLRESLGKLPVLDVCCGRGEWLSLLQESQVEAEGVDINDASLEECRARDLKVHHQDAFEFLRATPDASYLAVTSFHFVEHIPLQALLKLVDEIRRVLIPGGKIMLETPNPSNLIVGAHTFYMDPTHERPLPPEFLRFVVTQRGFREVSLRELQPASETAVFHDFAGAEVLNKLLFDCQDYCVIGTK